jgi:4-amino-4-deoxy-L-arabinose transferase
VLLATSIAVPLLVFCLARSRLPLYLLPLFVPLALVAARCHVDGRLPRARWLLAWAGVLLALKLAAAAWSTHKDASAWARAIAARVDGPVPEVVFVDDMARYGVRFYLGGPVQVRKISVEHIPDPKFVPDWDAALADVLATRDPRAVWICRERDFARVQGRIAHQGHRAVVLGAAYRGRRLFRVSPARTWAPANAPPAG